MKDYLNKNSYLHNNYNKRRYKLTKLRRVSNKINFKYSN